MSKIVLHIGLHKTATTSLQGQFFPACEGLNALTTLNPKVRKFIEEVTRRDPLFFDPARAKAIISSQFISSKVNILTNESLSGPPYAGVIEAGLDHRSPVLTNLSNVFPDAKVILVLRRQDALAKSFYRQYLKSGGTRNVRRFYGFEPDKGPPLMCLDRFYFFKYVEAVVSTFKSGVLILPFEEFTQNQKYFLGKITDFMEVPMPDLSLKRENSTRLGPLGMEVSRMVNYLFRSLLNPAGMVPGVRVVQGDKNHRISPMQFLHDQWPKSKRVKDGEVARLAGEIFRSVEEDNRKLDKEFGLNLKKYNYYK